jgi:hypothetical protein
MGRPKVWVDARRIARCAHMARLEAGLQASWGWCRNRLSHSHEDFQKSPRGFWNKLAARAMRRRPSPDRKLVAALDRVTPRIDPGLVTLLERFISMKVLLIGPDPILRNIPLRGSQIELAFTNHLMQTVFQFVLGVCIPHGGVDRFRPQIVNVI